MKLVKVLILLGAGLIALLAIVLVVAFISIDKLAKTGIQHGTQYALAVPTSLDSADVGVFSGTFDMAGLQVDNPEGYKSPFFFRLGEGGVAVSLGSLSSDVVTLPKLELADIDLHIDRADGKSNIKQILDNLKRFEKDEPAEPSEPKPADDEAPGKKFVVNEIAIRNVTAHVHLLPLGGELSTTKLVIPEIILKDVGSAGDPVSLSEITNIVIQAILASAAEIGGGVIPDEVLGDLKTNLEGLQGLADSGVQMLTEGVDKAVGDAKEQLEGAADELEEKAKGAINEGINSILGGGSNKDKPKDSGGG